MNTGRRAGAKAIAALVVWLALPAFADEVVKPVRLESAPVGAQVFLLRGTGRKQVCAATPCDWQAGFHSELSVLRLRFELAGHAGATVEVTPASKRAAATLKWQGGNADTVAGTPAVPVQSPRLQRLQARLAPAMATMARSGDAAGKIVHSSAPASLREIDGRVFLWLPLAVGSLDACNLDEGKGASVRAMWTCAGSAVEASLRDRFASEGVDGVVIIGTLGHVSGHGSGKFSVSGQAEATTELACIPGTVMQYNSCARTETTYGRQCTYYNGNSSCRDAPTGSRCVGGQVAAYSACASKAPVTKYTVKANPQFGIGASAARSAQGRLIGVSGWSGKTKPSQPTLMQIDASGRLAYAEGPAPSASLKRALGLR